MFAQAVTILRARGLYICFTPWRWSMAKSFCDVHWLTSSSPECVPSQNSLDFSVYNLDPAQRSRTSRAFPSSSATASSSNPGTPAVGDPNESWSGKGLLSWALSELDQGKTLVRGRLVREYEFGMAAFNDSGGLEGLMAAASRGGASGSAGSGHDPADGKGWGLEVVICLKVVPWIGAGGIGGRTEFEEMLSKGREGLGVGVGGPIPSIPVPNPAANGQATRTDIPQATASHPNRPMIRPVPHPPRVTPSAASTPVPQALKSTVNQATYRPPAPRSQSARTNPLSSAPERPSSVTSNRSQPSSAQPPSSLPPSLIPMASSSSAQSISRPSSAADHRHSSVPPSSSASTGTSKPPPRSAALNGSSFTPQPPPSSQPLQSSSPKQPPPPRDRQVTPSPRPQPKSPPPSTSSRATLRALLQSDSKMSPGLAKSLATNPTLLKLLKAVPASALSGNNLRSDSNPSTSSSSSKSNHGSNGTNGNPFAVGLGTQSGSASDVKPSPAVSDIPTPSSTNTIRADGEGCCNCGTTETDVWRIKRLKDGTEKKVCNSKSTPPTTLISCYVRAVIELAYGIDAHRDSLWDLLQQAQADATSRIVGNSQTR